MNRDFDNIDALIAKVLDKAASSEEIQAVQDWKALNKENADYFDSLQKMFSLTEHPAEDFHPDLDKAWNNLQQTIEEDDAVVVPISRKTMLYRMAAAIGLMAMLISITYYWLGSSDEVKFVASAQVLSGELPDGSKVVVSKNSSLTFEKFEGRRVVKLKGEAYFDVVHNEKEEFEIEVGKVLVKDIGTKFRVLEDLKNDQVKVTVDEGSVQFYTNRAEGIVLVAGETGVYENRSGNFSRLEQPAATKEERISKVFEFKDIKLSEVVSRLNLAYGSNIVIENPATGNCTITTMFADEDLDFIISTIAETFDLEILKEKDRIILKGGSCSK